MHIFMLSRHTSIKVIYNVVGMKSLENLCYESLLCLSNNSNRSDCELLIFCSYFFSFRYDCNNI